MARVRVYTRAKGQPFSALYLRLKDSRRLTEQLAELLVTELEALVPFDRGVLYGGALKVELYQKRGERGTIWAAGIGDPNILTDWHNKAPKGTISEFIGWLRQQAKKARAAKKAAKERKAIRKAQKAEARYQARRERIQAPREAARKAFEKAAERYLTQGKEKGLKEAARKATHYRIYGQRQSFRRLLEEVMKIAKEKRFGFTQDDLRLFRMSLSEILITERGSRHFQAQMNKVSRSVGLKTSKKAVRRARTKRKK